MAPGDLTLYDPGHRVNVTLVANENGALPARRELVRIDGQNDQHTEVALATAAGTEVATLAQMPEEYSGDPADYAAGDEVGEATVLLRHPVDWLEDSDGALAPSDQVVGAGDGGVRALDTAGGDTEDMVIGTVWTTLQRDQHTADAVAVVRQRR